MLAHRLGLTVHRLVLITTQIRPDCTELSTHISQLCVYSQAKLHQTQDRQGSTQNSYTGALTAHADTHKTRRKEKKMPPRRAIITGASARKQWQPGATAPRYDPSSCRHTFVLTLLCGCAQWLHPYVCSTLLSSTLLCGCAQWLHPYACSALLSSALLWCAAAEEPGALHTAGPAEGAAAQGRRDPA